MCKRIKVGLLGVGHLGKIHARLIADIPLFECVGFFDPDNHAAEFAKQHFGLNPFSSPDGILDNAEAVIVATPTSTHYDIAMRALQAGKHVFIEKPLAENSAQASDIAALANAKKLKVMVGHVERFNPAMLALPTDEIKPLFIETHRLSQFNPRGTDVSVVHDLMIHDLDIILGLVNAEVENISASGVAIISNTPDIANARIEFTNGCVANVTASRISMKNMRKMRIFQPGAYLSVDFLKGKSDIIKIHDTLPTDKVGDIEIELDGKKKTISLETRTKTDVNAIKMELEIFANSILHNTTVPVSAADGLKAMLLAERILQSVMENSKRVAAALNIVK